MKYPPIPDESKSQINKAGNILASRIPGTTEDFKWGIDLVSRWREGHSFPLNTLQAALKNELKKGSYRDFVVAQRLKRLPTIIEKLKRFPSMQVTTMQDIGGLRAILRDIAMTYKISEEYRNGRLNSPMLITKDIKDYIKNPRDEDGYRGIHFTFRFQHKKRPEYDGLKIEIQFRTKLQHAWATAVESMGTFLGQSLKSRQGEKDWLEFFCLISSAFAFKEGTARIPKYIKLSEEQTHEQIQLLDKKLGAMDKLIGLSAVMRLRQNLKRGFYYLLILDSINQSIEIRSYTKTDVFKASEDYTDIEMKVNENILLVEPVLVSSASLSNLRKAFPNYFLDTKEFISALRPILNIKSRRLTYKEIRKKR